MPKILRFLTIAFFLMSLFSAGAASGSSPDGLFKTPDFAFPQTVSTDARDLLGRAEAAGDTAGVVRIRAMLELTVATSSIDRDSIFAMPALIGEQAARTADKADRAMLLALETNVLQDIYQDNAWNYNNADVPAGTVPGKINLWGRDNFRDRTRELIDSALSLTAGAPAVALQRYSACLEYSPDVLAYMPDVRAFLFSTAIDIANTFGERDRSRQLVDMALAETTGAPNLYWLSRRDSGNREALLQDYLSHSTEEAARLLLADYSNTLYIHYNSGIDDARLRLTELLRESLSRFPDWCGNAGLRNTLAHLIQPVAELSVPRFCAAGQPLGMKVDFRYAHAIRVEVYRQDDDADKNNLRDGVLFTAHEFEPSDSIGSRTIDISPDRPGKYSVRLLVDGAESNYPAMFTAVDFMPFVLGGTDRNAVVTVDFTTGAPFGRVEVDGVENRYRRNRSDRTVELGRTDSKGILFVTDDALMNKTSYLSFRNGGHSFNFARSLDLYPISGGNRLGNDITGRIMTDRALYHPGDSLRWAAIVARKDGGGTHVAAGYSFRAILLDANRQEVDTISLTTDNLGRAEGSFAIPRGLLTGNYTISLRGADGYICNRSVTVSDFKLPTVFAEFTAVERDVPSIGCVTLTGKVLTYSGMPVAGVSVEGDVFGASRLRWFMVREQLGTVADTTGADGTFRLVVPADILGKTDGNGERFSDFQINALATTVNAETASASKNFTTGKPLVLAAEFPALADGCKSVHAKIMAYNASGENVAAALRWSLGRADQNGTALADTLLQGTAIAGEAFALELAGIPAGRYSVQISPDDESQADSAFAADVITVYNTATGDVPALDSPLFLPESDYTFGTDGKVRVALGVAEDDVTVYTAIRKDRRLIEVKPRGYSRAFHYIEIDSRDLPEDGDAEVMFVAVRRGAVYSQSIALHRPAAPQLRLETESFRNRLVPGDTETWRFRVQRAGQPVAGAGMIATMFNGALESLEGYSLPGNISFYRPSYSINLSNASIYRDETRAFKPINESEDYVWSWPEWRYLSQNRFGYGVYPRLMMKNMAMGVGSAPEPEMAFDEAESVEEGSQIMRSSLAVNETADMAGGITEDAAVEEEEIDGDSAEGRRREPEVEYRDAFVLQAFFMPALVSDSEGNVDVVFTVPNANGTWALRALAWTSGLEMARYEAEAVASKPVMVQPNLPRFLRQGDRAVLGATVFNNSDSTATVTTTVEIFNVETGEVLETREFVNTLDSKASAVVSVETTAPADRAAVGYRARSVAGRFADGEQTAIPVLSSAGTVIESTEFYLNPTQEPLTLDIPVHEATSYTLQYCSNPIWTIVRALRGIFADKPYTSCDFGRQLFSVLAARKVAAGNPNVADAYHQWVEHPEDEALTSMLSRNADLKALLLDQTPWVQTAASESARMAALGNIFDRSKVDAAIESSVKGLRDLQNRDGGFAWASWAGQSSVYCTRDVLLDLGLARSMDMLGSRADELTALCRDAYAYVQTKATEEPHPATTDMDFAFISALWPDFGRSAQGQALLDRTLADIERGWRRMDTDTKALALLILKANGHDRTAATILESLRQFAVERPGQGLCFPSVDDIRDYGLLIQAFAAMDVPRETIDAMRQWVLVRAQATDDLGAWNPDYVISSLLLTGSDWTAAPLAFGLIVNGSPAACSAQERATGYTSMAVAPEDGRLSVEIRPNGATPSYGSVVSVGLRQLESVAARPGRDLTLEKRFLVERDGQWVETRAFVLGQRVRVQLVLEVGRDMEYVTITDRRPAAFEPADQLPGFVSAGSLMLYRENGDAETRLFAGWLPRGTYHIAYDMTANNAGEFISGTATVQSQYALELTAHSSGCRIAVSEH